ncbi:MAG: hypothetical protein ACJ790_19755 [Myxococcaceae bacterium]
MQQWVQGKRYVVFSLFERGERRDDKGNLVSGKETIWTRAGSAWVNRDGSLNLVLDVLPLQGRLHVREQSDKRDERPSEAQQKPQMQLEQMAAPSMQQAEALQSEAMQSQAQHFSFNDATASMGDH